MEMIPALRGTGMRKSKPYAPRKKGEGTGGGEVGRKARGETCPFGYIFFFSGEGSHHSVS